MSLFISVSKQIRMSDLGLRVPKGEITRLNFQAINPSVIIIMSKPIYISLFYLPHFLPPKKQKSAYKI